MCVLVCDMYEAGYGQYELPVLFHETVLYTQGSLTVET